MSDQVLLAMISVFATMLWIAIKHVAASHRDERQRRIAEAGEACFGRVVAIQRPFMLDDCTRLYFDFVPSGSQEPIRACHVARRAEEQSPRALPVQGAIVAIRYLPDEPRRAVIGKLVSG